MLTKDTLDTILGMAKPEIQTPMGAQPFVVIPQTQKVESLEKLFPPTRIKLSVNLLEAGSFIEYVNRFKSANTLIFANVTETDVRFKAILDYHTPAPGLTAAYCDHIATFSAIETPEWKTWKTFDRKPCSQVDFATFLEDNVDLFVLPSGAELLELVRTLHGHRNARFNTHCGWITDLTPYPMMRMW